MELVRLAEEPRVDAQALKECVAQDPALTCKVLRVVNSSLYGLNRPVADLSSGDRAAGHQAAEAAGAGIQSAGRAVCRSGGARAAMVLDEHADARRGGAAAGRAACGISRATRRSSPACCRTSASSCCCASWASRTRSFLTGVIEEKCHLGVARAGHAGIRSHAAQRGAAGAVAIAAAVGRCDRGAEADGATRRGWNRRKATCRRSCTWRKC